MALFYSIKQLKSQPFLLNKTEERSSAQPIMKIIKKVLPQQVGSFIGFKPKLEGPNMRVIEAGEYIANLGETALVLA